MQPRTKRQKEVLDYVTRFIDRNGHKPSYQQIAMHLGVRSRAGVQRHIAALESQGLIARRRENGRFGIDLPLQQASFDKICAVDLIEMEGEDGKFTITGQAVITVPRYLLGEVQPIDAFAIRMPDYSLIDRQICNDDLVVFERRNYARRGEIVAAKIESGTIILGVYHQHGRETEIRPAGDGLEPSFFPADEIWIEGVMLGLMRFTAASLE